MSQAQILVLGAIAGLTIFIGLPVGRIGRLPLAASAFLAATATGILLFLLWDVLAAGVEPVEGALTAAVDDTGSWGRFAWLAALLGGGFVVGLMSLVYFDELIARRRRNRGPYSVGAAVAVEADAARVGMLSPAQSLALMIATGIGLHNFSEGLAIGQSAASGEISLALMLIIGFGLHNATEGFGIVGPFATTDERPSWAFLLVVGLIGGGPTFFGTLLGQTWVSDALSVAFLALAAGSILYVVIELLDVCRRAGRKRLVAWGLVLGLALGFGTDFVLVAAGA
ncbi:MAG TPA: ZIP family metal transporter [Gaiella sp.]